MACNGESFGESLGAMCDFRGTTGHLDFRFLHRGLKPPTFHAVPMPATEPASVVSPNKQALHTDHQKPGGPRPRTHDGCLALGL